MTIIVDSNAVAGEIRSRLVDAIDALSEAGVEPRLVTVLMSNDPVSETYASMRQRDCGEIGTETLDYEFNPEMPIGELCSLAGDLNDDDEVHGTLVQMPIPDHADDRAVLRHIDLVGDIDSFHPENVDRLTAGDVHFGPCTPHGVRKLLVAIDVRVKDADMVVVSCPDIVGKLMANLLIQKAKGGNTTVAVCRSRTDDLTTKTCEADITATATGVPKFVTGDVLSEDVVIIDASVNRVNVDNERDYGLVNDAEFDSTGEKVSAITPVPGGVGPMTRAMFLWNTVRAATKAEGVDVDLP